MSTSVVTPSARAEEQRRRVVARSVEIFSRRGFRATSMNDIATAVGLSKPTLYHYFRSKEEILVRIHSDVLDEGVVLARAAVAAAATPLDAIRALVACRVAYVCRNQALMTVCFEEERELSAELAAPMAPKRAAIEAIVLDALSAHLAAHPEVRLPTSRKVWVHTCMGAANWTYRWYRSDGPASPEELGALMAESLVAGITPAR